MKHLAPAYIYTPQGLQSNMIISISDDGRINTIMPRGETSEGVQCIVPSEVSALAGVALLPGFVNTHSHVFQRALRGHTHRPLSRQDTFWTWRRSMYAEAQHLNPDTLYEKALTTYREMLGAGYTSVGEFHYVHHQPGGRPYNDPNAMSEAIIQAWRDAGIRVVLLMTAYAQSGFNQPPEEDQRRFCDVSVDAYLDRVEALRVRDIPIGVALTLCAQYQRIGFAQLPDIARSIISPYMSMPMSKLWRSSSARLCMAVPPSNCSNASKHWER